MSTGSRTRKCGTVLAVVKAKPFGWPSASLDPGSRSQAGTYDRAGPA